MPQEKQKSGAPPFSATGFPARFDVRPSDCFRDSHQALPFAHFQVERPPPPAHKAEHHPYRPLGLHNGRIYRTIHPHPVSLQAVGQSKKQLCAAHGLHRAGEQSGRRFHLHAPMPPFLPPAHPRYCFPSG